MAKQKPDTESPHEPVCFLHVDDIVEIKSKIASLTAKVTNGLTDRVEAMDKRLWGIAGMTIIQLIGLVFLLVVIVLK